MALADFVVSESDLLDPRNLGDQRWRLDNLYWIVNEKGEKVPFRLNWAQDQLYSKLHYLNLILKARQLGFTTFIQVFMLDCCMFHGDTHAGTIAHTREDAEAFFRDKVKFPYDNLPPVLRDCNPAIQDSARTLAFKNGSVMRVGTSLRSGTNQYLHISEYGKICAKYPEKATEIRTGALNTVHPGQMIFIESTAEGSEGDFFDKCEDAQSSERKGQKPGSLDYKFFFFPWWRHPGYKLNEEVLFTKRDRDYFSQLEEEKIYLTDAQKAWYVKKSKEQGEEMKREFPSTPKEAFESSIEGAYYAEQMARMEEEGRIGDFPHQTGKRIETWWDLGMNDSMTIAFVQRIGQRIHFIDYYENNGYGLEHYARYLQDKQKVRRFVYGPHIWPHDGNARILDETGRKRTEVMRDLGYQVKVVPRGLLNPGIEAVRQQMDNFCIDEENCADLIRALKAYRREWDENRGVYRDRPLHDWASHGADMVRTGCMYRPSSGRKGPIKYPDQGLSRPHFV